MNSGIFQRGLMPRKQEVKRAWVPKRSFTEISSSGSKGGESNRNVQEAKGRGWDYSSWRGLGLSGLRFGGNSVLSLSVYPSVFMLHTMAKDGTSLCGSVRNAWIFRRGVAPGERIATSATRFDYPAHARAVVITTADFDFN